MFGDWNSDSERVSLIKQTGTLESVGGGVHQGWYVTVPPVTLVTSRLYPSYWP